MHLLQRLGSWLKTIAAFLGRLPLVRQARLINVRTRLLMGVAILCASRGVAYTVTSSKQKLPFGLDQVATVFPIVLLGVIWCAAAAGLAYTALKKRQGDAAILLASFILILWAAGYVITWIQSGYVGSYLLTVIFYGEQAWSLRNAYLLSPDPLAANNVAQLSEMPEPDQ